MASIEVSNHAWYLPQLVLLSQLQYQSQNTANCNAATVTLAAEDVLSEVSSKASKSAGSANSDELDEKAKAPVVQQKGRFKVTSENVDLEKVVPSPILQKSHSLKVITPHPAIPVGSTLPSPLTSSIPSPSDDALSNHAGYSFFPRLHTVLQTNIVQRDNILSLMKQITAGGFTANCVVDAEGMLAHISLMEKSLLPFELVSGKYSEDCMVIVAIGDLGSTLCLALPYISAKLSLGQPESIYNQPDPARLGVGEFKHPDHAGMSHSGLLEAAHDREKELLHEITELQWRLIHTQDELQKLKTENAQDNILSLMKQITAGGFTANCVVDAEGMLAHISLMEKSLLPFELVSGKYSEDCMVIVALVILDRLYGILCLYGMSTLLKPANMECRMELSMEEKVEAWVPKVVPEAHYIFVHEVPNGSSPFTGRLLLGGDTRSCLSPVSKEGTGEILMQLIELVPRKNQMRAVMLTVQKANSLAMNFYLNKLRWSHMLTFALLFAIPYPNQTTPEVKI
ncbi:hypothetical protein CJ030_MR5G001752 [Morella rubra]|uniref:Uncharacterized protein n=1 Tax=Morella rubra TaxID=262757 RepID=A0A6A1VK03_9ROSI|nr:hypothetical protein CJ030_MR5G001752 [Morella rubra]